MKLANFVAVGSSLIVWSGLIGGVALGLKTSGSNTTLLDGFYLSFPSFYAMLGCLAFAWTSGIFVGIVLIKGAKDA